MKLFKHFIGIILLVLGSSCSSDLEFEDLKDNLPFISLSEDTDMDNLSEDDYEAIFRAIPRFKIFENEDGLYEVGVKTAAEIRVSDNIYYFVLQIIDNSNERLLANCGGERNVILSRSGGVRECVAVSLRRAINLSDDEEKAMSDYITTEYKGRGMPYEHMLAYIQSKHPNTIRVSPAYFTPGETLGNNFIIVISNGDGTGHAVNGFKVDEPLTSGNSASFFFLDYQTNSDGSLGVTQSSNILGVFICQ